MVVLTFPDLRLLNPTERWSDSTWKTTTPQWALKIEDYPMLKPETYTIDGPKGGRAIVTYSGIAGKENPVVFEKYTKQDGTTFDGKLEIAGMPVGAAPSILTGDVAISGAHTGRFQIKVAGEGTQVFGIVITTRDGRTIRTQLGQWTPNSPFIPPDRLPNGADADGIDP